MLTEIVTGAVSLLTSWIGNKKEESKAKTQQKIALMNKVSSWEELQAKGSQTSWKDEFWTIIFAIPLVLCFIPSCVDYVKQGFIVLNTTPEWYRYCLLTLVGASVGVKKLNTLIKGKK